METTLSTYEQQAIDFLASTQTEFKSEFKEFNSMPFDTDGAKRNIFTITLKNARHSYSFDFGSSIADSCKETKLAKIDSPEPAEIFFGFRHNTQKGHVMFSHTIKTSYLTMKGIRDGKVNPDSLLNTEQIEKDFNKYRESIKAYNAKKYNFGHGIDGIKGSNIDEITAKIRNRISQAIKEASEDTDTLHTEQADTIKHPSSYDVLACITKSDPGTFEDFCSEFGYDTDSRKAVRTYKSVRKEWQNICKLFSDSEIEQLQEIN